MKWDRVKWDREEWDREEWDREEWDRGEWDRGEWEDGQVTNFCHKKTHSPTNITKIFLYLIHQFKLVHHIPLSVAHYFF